MDRLTLTVYAEQQPARAMKWWKPGGVWSNNCWCAKCTDTVRDVSPFTTASATDWYDVDYCIRCHARLEFADHWT